MKLPEDVDKRLRQDFPHLEIDSLIERLCAASQSPRIQRCIVFASRGNRAYFGFLCELARIDSRDVIVSAECDRYDTQLYDFNLPYDEAMRSRPYGDRHA